jgi:DNA (cytosine-5)-methyltransferase 1
LEYHKTEKYKNGKPKRVYKKLVDSDECWENYIHKYIIQIKKWGHFELNDFSKELKKFDNGIGREYVKASKTISSKHTLYKWFHDSNLKGLANHQSRSHLAQDLVRYLFSCLFVDLKGTFPRMDDFAKHNKVLVPDHENAASGKFNDRFRVQLKNKPATTITSHISKDGHYFIHYDAKQCRSLTVREAARIQTFPDNYLFRGSRTAQFHQVGNAVPPFLAYQVSQIVFNIIKNTVLDE